MDLTFVIAVVFIGIGIVYPLFYYVIYEPLRVLLRWLYHLYRSRLSEDDKLYLEKNFSFYHALSSELKQRFQKRVATFLHYKKFVGVDIEVTDEMKLFVSATAIQLTFGLRNFWLTEFDVIRLHSDSYALASYHRTAMGDVSNKGVISLSWNDLKKGFENGTDGINVGLHEMAHALYLSSVEKGWNLSFATDYNEYEKQAVIEWKRGKSSDEKSVRDYGYTNLFEFFAVSVEYFFEKPGELQAAAPIIFYELQKLLRLNPLDGVNPILFGKKILYPSQPIPYPQYGPAGLLRKVFLNRKTILFFSAAILCIAIAVTIFVLAIRFEELHPGDPNPYSFDQFIAMVFLFFAGIFFIQLSGDDSWSKQQLPEFQPKPRVSIASGLEKTIGMIFASPGSFIFFILGTCASLLGLFMIMKPILFEIHDPSDPDPFSGFAQSSGYTFFIAFCCYIQVFYNPKKKS